MHQRVFALLSVVIPALAQPAAQSQPGSPQKIVVLQGEGALNNIQSGTATDPVVEVRDSRDLPVSGADVTFQLPSSGPGGFFPGRSLAFKTRTNENGQAAASGLAPNNVPGRFVIRATAALGSSSVTLAIAQRNVANATEAARAAKTHPRTLKWTLIGIAASAGITVGVLYATHTIGGGSSPTNSLTVSPGPITIGSPH